MQGKEKTIWIINQYASTPETGMGGRHYYLAKELALRGNKVFVFAASFTHLLRKPVELNCPIDVRDESGFKMVWMEMPEYQGAHDKRRIFNWLKFGWEIIFLNKNIKDKPDVIIYSSPSLIGYLGAFLLSRRQNCKLLLEVRDIWPLTLQMVGGYSDKNVFVKALSFVERFAYRRSDAVISNLKYAFEHMEQKGMERDKFVWIPNGLDVNELSSPDRLDDSIADKIPKDKFIIGYVGTLGLANSVVTLLQAAEMLKNDDRVAFLIVGGGREKDSLLRMSEKLGLNNVFFIDPIPKKSVQSIIKFFDVCYIGSKKVDLYRYGIGANKIPEYMFSGKPIIHSYSGRGDPVSDFSAGVSIEAENPGLLKLAILQYLSMDVTELERIGRQGRVAALEYFDYAKLAEKLDVICDDINY